MAKTRRSARGSRRLSRHSSKKRNQQYIVSGIAFVAIGKTHEALSPGLLIQHHDNGFYTVFVPTVPTPTVGNIYLVPEDKVFIVDVPFLDMVQFITKWGQSSPALLEAIRQIKPTKNNLKVALLEDEET